MLRLVMISSDAPREAIEFGTGTHRLGRSHGNDFLIEHPTVSATHCEMVCQEDAVLVRDCGSTNGTFINGQPITEARLKPGQTLRLGEVEMVLEAAPVTVAIPPVDFSEPPPPPPLADGAMACLNHAEIRARRKCTQCRKCFCDPCVHTLRRVGGKVLKLCPACSGPCEIILCGDEGKRKKKSLLDRMRLFKKTLRLSRKR